MSTVKADNFTWKTGEATAQTAPTVTGQQIAYGVGKYWIDFNGTTTTPTVRASFNHSSITDNGTGNFVINFANALTDANHAAVANYTNTNSAAGSQNDGQAICWGHTSTAVSVFVSDGGGTARDPFFCSVIILR